MPIYVFVSQHVHYYFLDQLQWLTIRSSCSAPSYFRATGRYLDGGLIANNPTLDAMSEVHKFKKYKKSEGCEQSALGLVLSLGKYSCVS